MIEAQERKMKEKGHEVSTADKKKKKKVEAKAVAAAKDS